MKWPYKVRHRKNGPILARIYKPKKPDKGSPNPTNPSAAGLAAGALFAAMIFLPNFLCGPAAY